jgi:IS30 family transposase
MTIASAKAFRSVPKVMRKTLTVDNGKEFAYFKQLEKKTGFSIYFADPYSAWQRGSNENTNGLIRQYFPKGTNFKDITNKDLALVMKKLNHRPRRTLIMKKKQIVFVFILAALFVFTTSQFLLAGERTVKLTVPGCV